MPFKNNLNVKLDSRLIFETDKIYASKVIWSPHDKITASEWIYCGLHDDLDYNMILTAIADQFPTDPLYFSHLRDNSTQITRADFISGLTNYIGNDFRLWDIKFERVLEFSKVGVIRLGTTASN